MSTLRIVREYIQFQKANHQNIFFKPDENDCKKIKALIIGPPDTPYQGAILLFDILARELYEFKDIIQRDDFHR